MSEKDQLKKQKQYPSKKKSLYKKIIGTFNKSSDINGKNNYIDGNSYTNVNFTIPLFFYKCISPRKFDMDYCSWNKAR